MFRSKTAVVIIALIGASPAPAGDIGFAEDFALAKDRATVLKLLIPGTEDYYYYHCLHYQNSEQFDKVDGLLKPWYERFRRTPRLTEIETRQALLTYDKNPKKSLEYLRSHLNLNFNHTRPIADRAPELPTSLDQAIISRAKLFAVSMAQSNNLENFEGSALDWLAVENLDWERRRQLLQRLERPDIANLAKLIADDLAAQHAGEFGYLPIHRQLTLAQLEELQRLRPALANQMAFVNTWISKLHPGADDNWRQDPIKAQAYLDRALGFTRKLEPIHNTLKAHLLYHRLALGRAQGKYNKELLLEYLKLPRRLQYVSKSQLQANEMQRFPCDLAADLRGTTLLPSVGNDEPLIRAYLKQFLAAATSPREFEPFINDVYLRHLFAETKIELGLGESEQWASQLPPEAFRLLRDRTDIDFAPTNKVNFAADGAVALDMFIKNVPTLVVKVFEINTQNYYRDNQRELDTDINLDGMVANWETTHTYSEEPLRRMPRRFEFPQLKAAGVYVIDFIGAGKSSRALIRKGRLRPLFTTTTAGQLAVIVDDANRLVTDAAIWLGGHVFKANADGKILIPFTTQPGRQPIIISRGSLACLDYLDHHQERYDLKAGFYVDRESLLPQCLAHVLVRPNLTINGNPVSLKVLENAKLKITATDLDGIVTSTDIANFKLFEDREATYQFRVPTRLAQVVFSLEADVKSLSEGKPIHLAATDSFSLNGFAVTDQMDQVHLAKFGNDYFVEFLGRTGEPRPDRSVQFYLKHCDFRQPVHASLRTDAKGQIRLGALSGIDRVVAESGNQKQTWNLAAGADSYRRLLHAKAGETIAIPYWSKSTKPGRDELALFEVLGNNIRADRLDSVAIKDGAIELHGLPAGDYDLWIKRTGHRMLIRIVEGPAVAGNVLGSMRQLQLPLLKPFAIANVGAAADAITIKLREASPFTRVHVLATRYLPSYAVFDRLGQIRDAELTGVYPSFAESTYLAGRNIGDEYRYILDRRQFAKRPGNMLDRPEILLNPWTIRSTETGEQRAKDGEDYRRRGTPTPAAPAMPPPGNERLSSEQESTAASPYLDYLADPANVLINLIPDKDGQIRIPREQLGPHNHVVIVAVDPTATMVRTVHLPETPLKSLDLRLRAGFDPKISLTRQKQIRVLPTGQPIVLADTATDRFEAYDSLARVHALYSTLTRDAKLAEFSFVIRWPSLAAAEKRSFYSKHACHELNFFIFRRDPEFFQSVVKPFVTNKKDKTFLDHWLLGSDLAAFTQAWQYGRLNTVERVLLAQRIAGEPAKTTRHIKDQIAVRPPEPEQLRRLFDTAIRGSALAAQPELTDALGQVAPSKAVPVPSPSGMAGGGFGGGDRPGGPPPESRSADRGILADKEKNDNKHDVPKARDGATRQKEEAKSAAKSPAEADGDESQLRHDLRPGQIMKQLYRRVDPTQEWAENNYYQLPIQQQLADLIGVSAFWLDYAQHDGKSPFLSRHIASACNSFSEMMFALSVLDLPFDAGKHDVKFEGAKMTLTPVSPIIAFIEEVRRAAPAGDKSPILVSQDFYLAGDRHRIENGEKSDKFVSGEFVAHTVYGCQIVVTNPSSSRQRLSALLQVPVGAIPVANGQFTRSMAIDLEPYGTRTLDYQFYFPAPGDFAHYPVQVAKNEAMAAVAASTTFHVVVKASKHDTESWEYVSQNGSNEQVLAMLGRENTSALDLTKILFRLKDPAFFNAVTQLLKDRHVYQPAIWSYALLHNVPDAAREYLRHNQQFTQECGGPIASPLLTIHPIQVHTYEHLEYKPLVNSRAHPLGKRRQIVNDKINEQYHRFLSLLSHQAQLTDQDRLATTYYLLLQDRIEEAESTFAQVNRDAIETRLQNDYCQAYLDMFKDQPTKARILAKTYADFPVDRWRVAFANLAAQLDELENREAMVADAGNREQRQGKAAEKEASFDFTVDSKAIQLTWQNVQSVRVNYYLMDVELLFSRNPFGLQTGGQLAFIKPNHSQDIQLAAGQDRLSVPLPENLVKRNLLIEVATAGKSRALPYYANAMNIKMMENYGQLRVAEAATGKPIAKVYIKTYAKTADGQIKFHKDGYTDLRGRFDYASVSTPEKVPLQRFAVLAMSDDHGATIRLADPPLRPAAGTPSPLNDSAPAPSQSP